MQKRNKNECLCVVARRELQFSAVVRVERDDSRPSGSRIARDKMQACGELQSQDIPDELKTV